MNNHKLIMEGWRSFIVERQARQEESSVLTGAYLQFIFTTIKKTISENNKIGMETDLNDLEIKLSAGCNSFIREYISKTQTKDSKFLAAIKFYSVDVKILKTEKDKLVVVSNGGSFSTEHKSFNIKLKISGKINNKEIGKNFIDWPPILKIRLSEFTQHELEHVDQDMKGKEIEKDIKSAKNSKSQGLIDKAKRFIFGFISAEEDSEFEKHLRDVQNIIDHFATEENEGIVDILTYNIQQAEIEAYAVGWMRKAKFMSQEMNKKNKQRSRDQYQKFKIFDVIVEDQIEYFFKLINGQKFEKELEEIVGKIYNKTIDFMITRNHEYKKFKEKNDE